MGSVEGRIILGDHRVFQNPMGAQAVALKGVHMEAQPQLLRG